MSRLCRRILVLSLIALLFLALTVQAEPSRVVQAEEILDKIEMGQPVEYDGYTIIGDLNLSGLNLPRVPVVLTVDEYYLGLPDYEIAVTSPISITNSVVKGSVNLNMTAFQNATIFMRTRFEGPVFLMGSRFNDTARFEITQFNQIASFSYAQFNQITIFWNAQFNQEAQFKDAEFLNLSFENSQFSKDVFFDNAQINGTLSLPDQVRQAQYPLVEHQRPGL